MPPRKAATTRAAKPKNETERDEFGLTKRDEKRILQMVEGKLSQISSKVDKGNVELIKFGKDAGDPMFKVLKEQLSMIPEKVRKMPIAIICGVYGGDVAAAAEGRRLGAVPVPKSGSAADDDKGDGSLMATMAEAEKEERKASAAKANAASSPSPPPPAAKKRVAIAEEEPEKKGGDAAAAGTPPRPRRKKADDEVDDDDSDSEEEGFRPLKSGGRGKVAADPSAPAAAAAAAAAAAGRTVLRRPEGGSRAGLAVPSLDLALSTGKIVTIDFEKNVFDIPGLTPAEAKEVDEYVTGLKRLAMANERSKKRGGGGRR